MRRPDHQRWQRTASSTPRDRRYLRNPRASGARQARYQGALHPALLATSTCNAAAYAAEVKSDNRVASSSCHRRVAVSCSGEAGHRDRVRPQQRPKATICTRALWYQSGGGRRDHLKAAMRAACSAITRALSSSVVPAGSPLTSTVGLDHTGTRGQPPQLSLAPMMSRHLVPLT